MTGTQHHTKLAKILRKLNYLTQTTTPNKKQKEQTLLQGNNPESNKN